MSSITCKRLAEVIFVSIESWISRLSPVWLLNLGSDLSIDNILRLGLDNTKSGSQNAVKKVLELTEKWQYPNFRGKF